MVCLPNLETLLIPELGPQFSPDLKQMANPKMHTQIYYLLTVWSFFWTDHFWSLYVKVFVDKQFFSAIED